MTQSYFAAIGGNTPNGSMQSLDVVRRAVVDLGSVGFQVTAVSALYQTPAYPAGSGADFINAAVAFDSRKSPDEVLAIFHDIERLRGRQRQERWGPRTLDLDLLAQGARVLPDRATWRHWWAIPAAEQRDSTPDRLVLPHPRLQDRGFVLIPLRDIAPAWRHPVLERSVAEMCADLPACEVESVLKLADPPCV